MQCSDRFPEERDAAGPPGCQDTLDLLARHLSDAPGAPGQEEHRQAAVEETQEEVEVALEFGREIGQARLDEAGNVQIRR